MVKIGMASVRALFLGSAEIVKAYRGTDVVYEAGPMVLDSIAVTALPAKISYAVNETLNLSGVAVTATYTNGRNAIVTGSCAFSPVNGTVLSTVGTNTVTVSYTENGITRNAAFGVVVYASSSDNDLSASWIPNTLTFDVEELNTQTQNQAHSWILAEETLVIEATSGVGTLEYSSVYGSAPASKQVFLDENDEYMLGDGDLPDLGRYGDYVFAYWEYGAEQIVDVGTVISFVDGLATLSAIWEYDPLDITIDYESEFDQPEPILVTRDEESGFYVLDSSDLPDDLYEEGYTFIGWYYDAAYTEPANVGDQIDAGITLFAKWVEVI